VAVTSAAGSGWSTGSCASGAISGSVAGSGSEPFSETAAVAPAGFLRRFLPPREPRRVFFFLGSAPFSDGASRASGVSGVSGASVSETGSASAAAGCGSSAAVGAPVS